MRRTGAWLATYALEQLGVREVMGIPGVHVTELYDELERSKTLTPILVTHEGGGAFMADAISRTTGRVGALAIVPAAGITHALSGIGEAFLAGIPLLVLSGGVRRDSGRAFQLHDLDHQALLKPITKACYLATDHASVVPTLFEAYRAATTGRPGPVVVELPANLLLFQGEVSELPSYRPPEPPGEPEARLIREAVELLRGAKHPGLYLGWGAVDAGDVARQIAELLGAPVATTLQGLSAFDASHPLHAGMGFGRAAVPAARQAFAECDGLLAVGVRFAELATGSYSLPVPEQLIHVDIDPSVFSRNYPAKVALEGDARTVMTALLAELQRSPLPQPRPDPRAELRESKARYRASWCDGENSDAVSPGRFFAALRKRIPSDALVVCDDGNHTFLTAELFDVTEGRGFISPTDFNCMGYGVPAAIGAALGRPERQVVGVVGDGGFLMTGLELVTATRLGLNPVIFVFRDGELGQIAEFQKSLNRKTCTVLGAYSLEGVAQAVGARYLALDSDVQLEAKLDQALGLGEKRPTIVEVRIDYSRATSYSKGVLMANLMRFSLREKTRMIGRAITRRMSWGRPTNRTP